MNEPTADALNFEQALADLERIVRALEDGQIGLEESLAQYEQGVALLRRCHAQLRQVEQRILMLTGEDADGRPVVAPFEHAATLAADGRKRPRKMPEG
jgi:exodeoxyribonuclease VII small subunit